jgi:hypothetical protein
MSGHTAALLGLAGFGTVTACVPMNVAHYFPVAAPDQAVGANAGRSSEVYPVQVAEGVTIQLGVNAIVIELRHNDRIRLARAVLMLSSPEVKAQIPRKISTFVRNGRQYGASDELQGPGRFFAHLDYLDDRALSEFFFVELPEIEVDGVARSVPAIRHRLVRKLEILPLLGR